MILLRIIHAFATFIALIGVCLLVFLLMAYYMGLPVRVSEWACVGAGAMFYGIYIAAVIEQAIEKQEDK